MGWKKSGRKFQAPVAAPAAVPLAASAESSTPWLSKLASATDTAAHYFPLTAPAAWAGEGVASLVTGDKQKQRELAARAMGGAQSLSLGFADEASGLMSAQPQFAGALNPLSDVTMTDAQNAYVEGRDKYRGTEDAVRAWSSKQDSLVGPYAQGELGGTAAMLATPGGAVKGAGMAAGGLKGLAQSVLGAAAKSGLMGGVAGAGYSTDTTPEGVLADAGNVAWKSAALGGGLRLAPAAVQSVVGPRFGAAMEESAASRAFGRAKNAPKALPSPSPANAPIEEATVLETTLASPVARDAARTGVIAADAAAPAVADTAANPFLGRSLKGVPLPPSGTPEFFAYLRARGIPVPAAVSSGAPSTKALTVNQRPPASPAPSPAVAPAPSGGIPAGEAEDILLRGGVDARRQALAAAKGKALPAAGAGALIGGPLLAMKLAAGGMGAGAVQGLYRAARNNPEARAYILKKILGLSDDAAMTGDAATQQAMRYMASER